MSNQFSLDSIINALTNPENQKKFGSAAVPFVTNFLGHNQSEQQNQSQPFFNFFTGPEKNTDELDNSNNFSKSQTQPHSYGFMPASNKHKSEEKPMTKFPFLYQKPVDPECHSGNFGSVWDYQPGTPTQKKTPQDKKRFKKSPPQLKLPANVDDMQIVPSYVGTKDLVVETVSDGVSAVSTLTGRERPNKGEGNVIFLDKLSITIPEGTSFRHQNTKSEYTYGKKKETVPEIDLDDTVSEASGEHQVISRQTNNCLPITVKANTLWRGKDDQYGMLYKTQVDQQFYIERGVSVVFPANVVFYHEDTPMSFNKPTVVTLC